MSSLPADGALPTLCQEAQRAIVDGVAESMDERLRAHAASCAECQFLGDLSRQLARPTGSLVPAASLASGPLGPFVEACDRSLAEGEPVFSRYRLLERVGAGGQGVVYRAADLEAGEDTVAVKLVHCPPGGHESGSLEVLHARRVRHERICRVYHTERHGGVRLIVMEFIEGPSLAAARGRLSDAERRRVFREIAGAVHAAHGAGILHLDLKPSNVLLRQGRDPVVTDFGLSVSVAAGGTGLAAGGTRGYMAPEQERAEAVDRRTDVYALGRILAFLFSRPPRALRAVIARATAPGPADRYPDVPALLGALDRPARWRRRSLLLPAAAVLPLALLLPLLQRPAPTGVRAPWRSHLWGPDPLPADAWNVAVSRAGHPLPSVAVDHPPVACARNAAELIDGRVSYQQWEHGYAFHGPGPICVTLERLGYCGTLDPGARLCVTDGIVTRLLDLTVAQRDQVGPVEARLGQVERAAACDHDDSVVVTFDRPRWVFAARGWFHEGVPVRLGVDVEERSGSGWRNVFETWENHTWTKAHLSWPEREGVALSVPVTTEFAAALAQRVRYRVRCSDMRPYDRSQQGSPVWLYELELFARVPRWEAWWRHGLFSRRAGP
jgi:hypothetical protein